MKEKHSEELVPSHTLCHKIPYALLIKIDNYVKQARKHSRTEAINELLELALFLAENMKRIQDPQLMTEIHSQLKEGGLVDFVQTLTPKDFEVIHSIFQTEWKSRFKK